MEEPCGEEGDERANEEDSEAREENGGEPCHAVVGEGGEVGKRRQARVDLAGGIAVIELRGAGLIDAGIEERVALQVEGECEDWIGDEEKEHVANAAAQEGDAVEEDGCGGDDGESGQEDDKKRRSELPKVEVCVFGAEKLQERGCNDDGEGHGGCDGNIAQLFTERVFDFRDGCRRDDLTDSCAAVAFDRTFEQVEREKQEELAHEESRHCADPGGVVDGAIPAKLQPRDLDVVDFGDKDVSEENAKEQQSKESVTAGALEEVGAEDVEQSAGCVHYLRPFVYLALPVLAEKPQPRRARHLHRPYGTSAGEYTKMEKQHNLDDLFPL